MTRLLPFLLALALVATACGSSSTLVDARQYLDGQYQTAEAAGVWQADQTPQVVADALDINLNAKDSVLQSGSYYLRGQDWLAVVGVDGAGSRIELDDYDTGYQRNRTFIGGYWGSRPSSYGPRSSSGGSGGGGFSGVRGGGSGGGK